jgi:hypothetical protein
LSFVISSPEPSIRSASVVGEYVREMWEIIWLVWYGEITSPPHLFPQHFYLLKVGDVDVPLFSQSFHRIGFLVLINCMHIV